MNETHEVGRRPGRRVFATLGARWVQALLALGLVAALAVGGALLVHRAIAATLTVCSSCTYKSINDAIAAANPGDTITVQAGTYGPNETGAGTTDAEIIVTKPVTITGAGAGQSIINGIPTSAISGNTAFSAVPVMLIKPTVTGNVTISGFTFEGATYNGGANGYGQDIGIYDNNSSDVITVKDNLFYNDATLDPSNRVDQTDAIYPADGNATVNITGNRFQGIFRAMLAEGWAGPLSFTNNDLNLISEYDTVIPSQIDYWAEGLLLLADSGADLSGPTTISGNTFENYDGMAIGMDAGYGGGLVGALSNVIVSGNAFNNQGVLGAQDGPGHTPEESSAIYMHGFGTTAGSVFSSIWGVTIKNNTFSGGSATGHGYAVGMKGAMGGSISIDHNVMLGGGSSHPLAGVQFIQPSNTTGVSITNNIITGYATGLASDALPAGASVAAAQNCIAGNSAGASVASGTTLTLTNNWWGAASGPSPSGSGNAVSGSATYAPFLTAPATVCAGPVVSNVTASANPTPFQTGFHLSATVSDATTGGFGIASAWFTINGGPAYPLYWSGGQQVTVNAAGHVLISAVGRFTVCVQGKDVYGNTGPTSCYVEIVLQTTPTPTTSATATTGTGGTATPGTNPQPTATVGPPAPEPTATPGSSSAFFGIDTSSFPYIPVCLGILVLLVIIGVIVFYVRRRQTEERG